MPSAGTIEARLTLDAQQFVRAMEKARKQVLNLADEALSASKKQSIAINKLVTSYSGVSTTLRNVKNTQDSLRDALTKDMEKLKELGATSKEVDKLSKSFSVLELDVQDATQRMKQLIAAGDKEIKTAMSLRDANLKLAQSLREESARLDKVQLELGQYTAAVKQAEAAGIKKTATQNSAIRALEREERALQRTITATQQKIASNNAEIKLADRTAQAHLRSAQAMGSEVNALQRSEKAIIQKTNALVREEQKTRQAEEATRRKTAATNASAAASSRATHSFGTFSKAIGTSITLWYTFRTAIFAVRRALESVINIYKKGVEATDDFRLAVISASAIMADSIVEGSTATEKMGMALKYNTEMYKKLEVVAARHISTGKAVRDVYEGLIIARLFPGKEDVENIAKLADYITLYTKGQRLEVQLMQEVRGLMDGQVRAQNKLAYTLDRLLNGKLKEHIQLWRNAGRDASGQLVILKEITRLLGDIGTLQGEILATAETWENTLKTIAERLLRDSVIGYYADYRDLVQAISEYLFDLTEEYYTQEGILVKGIIQEGWLRLKDIARGFVGGELSQMREITTEIFRRMYYYLRENQQEFKNLGREARVAFEAIYFLVRNIRTIIADILLLAVPGWLWKMVKVFKDISTTGSILSKIFIAWGPFIAIAAYHTIKWLGTFENLKRHTEAMDPLLGTLGVSMGEIADEAERVPTAIELAKRQSEEFLALLEKEKQKQASTSDAFASFANRVGEYDRRIGEIVAKSLDDHKKISGALASENVVLYSQVKTKEELEGLDQQINDDLAIRLGHLASENVYLQKQKELKVRIGQITPTFLTSFQEDEKLEAFRQKVKQRTDKLQSDFVEGTKKITADALQAHYEAEGKRSDALKVAREWEVAAFDEAQKQKLQSLKDFITNGIKDEKLRNQIILEAGTQLVEYQEEERKAFIRKLDAVIRREIAKETDAKQKAVDSFNEWREKDEIAAQGRLAKLRADLALRGEQQVVDKITQIKINLAKQIEDIETTSQNRIAEATSRLVSQYGSIKAAEKAILAEKTRIVTETEQEKQLATDVANAMMDQVEALRQLNFQRELSVQKAQDELKIEQLKAAGRQIQMGELPSAARYEEIDRYKLALQQARDEFSKWEEQTWQQYAVEQNSTEQYFALLDAKLEKHRQVMDQMGENHEASMTKIKLLEAAGWAAIAESGVGNIAEMFRLMAQHNKKYFKWYQVFATGQVMINAAIAIMKTWATFAEVPPLAAALSATIAALAAAQAGVIWAQEPPSEMAEGGVGRLGLKGMYGVYNRPTYMVAEAGASEAVVPLDKYDISRKGAGSPVEVHHHYHINALDPASWSEFARRNPGPFREQFLTAIEENDPAVRGAVQAAAR